MDRQWPLSNLFTVRFDRILLVLPPVRRRDTTTATSRFSTNLCYGVSRSAIAMYFPTWSGLKVKMILFGIPVPMPRSELGMPI